MMRIFSIILAAINLAVCAGAAEAPDTLRFSHKPHIQDVGAICADCHTVEGGKPGVIVRAAETNCKKCHDNNTAPFLTPRQLECTKISWKSASLPDRPKFSHAKHLEKSQECAPCHTGIETTDKPGKNFIPGMKTCMTCHNDLKAPAACIVCHANLSTIKPSGHDALWIERGGHGTDAKFPSSECSQCHAAAWCDRCHQGNASVRIHPAGYEFEHGFDVKSKTSDCTVCHETPRSCNRCHEGKR